MTPRHDDVDESPTGSIRIPLPRFEELLRLGGDAVAGLNRAAVAMEASSQVQADLVSKVAALESACRLAHTKEAWWQWLLTWACGKGWRLVLLVAAGVAGGAGVTEAIRALLAKGITIAPVP